MLILLLCAVCGHSHMLQRRGYVIFPVLYDKPYLTGCSINDTGYAQPTQGHVLCNHKIKDCNSVLGMLQVLAARVDPQLYTSRSHISYYTVITVSCQK